MSHYLGMIKKNTGYTLDELVRGGVMNGKVIDHSIEGDCSCLNVAGNDTRGDGTHYYCSCSHPIRWAYEVTYQPTQETFDFGSTCIENWKIRCPDCASVKEFKECRINSVDQYYRCLECDAIFFKTRRELKKQRRAELKHEEECKELQRQIERIEQERIEYNEKVRQRQEERLRVAREKEEEEKKLNRKCVECNKYNIPKTLEAYRIRCGPCYSQFTKPKRMTK